jgi:hypothetical protein
MAYGITQSTGSRTIYEIMNGLMTKGLEDHERLTKLQTVYGMTNGLRYHVSQSYAFEHGHGWMIAPLLSLGIIITITYSMYVATDSSLDSLHLARNKTLF